MTRAFVACPVIPLAAAVPVALTLAGVSNGWRGTTFLLPEGEDARRADEGRVITGCGGVLQLFLRVTY